jgi:hypothetical protein
MAHGQGFWIGFGKGQDVLADALELGAAEGADDVEVEATTSAD